MTIKTVEPRPVGTKNKQSKGTGKVTEETLRHIAKLFASAIPQSCETGDFSQRVVEHVRDDNGNWKGKGHILDVKGFTFETRTAYYLKYVRSLPEEQKIALRCAYIFSRKVPKEEREDFFQELLVTLFEKGTKEEKLSYAIARCDWQDFWKKFRVRNHFSLDSVTEDNDGNETTLGEMIVGEAEFEAKQLDRMQAGNLWAKLPESIKPLVQKRIYGRSLTGAERVQMHRFVHDKGVTLLLG